jgi:hypothetical protein
VFTVRIGWGGRVEGKSTSTQKKTIVCPPNIESPVIGEFIKTQMFVGETEKQKMPPSSGKKRDPAEKQDQKSFCYKPTKEWRRDIC